MSAEDTGWVRAASRRDLAEGEALGIEVAGRSIALYDVDGTIFATDNICTHAYARLSDGWLDGELIECPLHAARFDVRTGKVLDPPATEDLKTYPVRIVGDEIQINLDLPSGSPTKPTGMGGEHSAVITHKPGDRDR
jgi:nitrite reductase/ring-hydroxylating ferredoxin subunit